MERKLENDLENQETWDYNNLEIKEPVKSPRVVMSVAFPHEDFLIVSKYAESLGKKTSEFIREAALEKSKSRGLEITISDFGSSGSLWFGRNLPSSTRVYTLVKDQELFEPVVTS